MCLHHIRSIHVKHPMKIEFQHFIMCNLEPTMIVIMSVIIGHYNATDAYLGHDHICYTKQRLLHRTTYNLNLDLLTTLY